MLEVSTTRFRFVSFVFSNPHVHVYVATYTGNGFSAYHIVEKYGNESISENTVSVAYQLHSPFPHLLEFCPLLN